ncbi:MAG: hypothetical protein JKY15_03435 [Deltaproteobacteria bacterium]|nr:hypothetical protein [Deltaproteobacteria bacterium]
MDAARTRREHEVWQACDDLWALNASLEALKGDHIREHLLKLGYKKAAQTKFISTEKPGKKAGVFLRKL